MAHSDVPYPDGPDPDRPEPDRPSPDPASPELAERSRPEAAAVDDENRSVLATSGRQRPLADVRGELQRLGYLDHQVERFLLQDALRPERPWQALWHLAVKVGLLIGVPAAVFTSLGLAGVNGHLALSPFDVLPLFLYLLVPLVLLPGLGFLVLASLLVLLLRVWHVRRIEATSFGLAVASALSAVGLALAQRGALVEALPRWQSTALALLAPLLAFAIYKVVHGGLLTLAIRLTDLAPEQPFGHGRAWIVGLVVATFTVMLPIAFGAGRIQANEPPTLPTTAVGRTIVLGVDGVLAEEVDYLLEGGELKHWARLADASEAGVGSAVVLEYPRDEMAPIAFWATVATGLESPDHGMGSIDTFRPAGLSRSLERSGWLRLYWQALARIGLATYEPVLANDRRAWSFWELATRGGDPGLVVGWWGTFPVEPMPGTSIGHGAYQLLDGQPGAPLVHPPELLEELAGLARAVRGGGEVDPSSAESSRVRGPQSPDPLDSARVPASMQRALGRALGRATAEQVLDKALRPDVFYRRAFVEGLASSPRIAALYLPGLDIAADTARLGSLALADLVRWQLRRVDALLADPPADVDTILVVLDPGRRRGAGVAAESREAGLEPRETAPVDGRALLWRRHGTCSGERGQASPPGLTAALLRGLGLPQSDELPEPPEVCTWPEPSLRLVGYGERQRSATPVEGDEYLRSLQALGYL